MQVQSLTDQEKSLKKRIVQASKIVDLSLKNEALTQDELRDYIDLGLQLGLSADDLGIIRKNLISKLPETSTDALNLDDGPRDNIVIESLTREKLIEKFAELVSNPGGSSLAQTKAYFILGISLGLGLTSIEEFRDRLVLSSNN